MNRLQRRASKSQQRHAFTARSQSASEAASRSQRAREAINRTVFCDYNGINIERSLVDRFGGMDFGQIVAGGESENRILMDQQGFDPSTFAMIERLGNRMFDGQRQDLHYLWLDGIAYITAKELIPYE